MSNSNEESTLNTRTNLELILGKLEGLLHTLRLEVAGFFRQEYLRGGSAVFSILKLTLCPFHFVLDLLLPVNRLPDISSATVNSRVAIP